MNAPHTPGPWFASWGNYLPIIATIDGKEAQIGRAESCGQISAEECEANADLIAAAPDLLAACKLAIARTPPNSKTLLPILQAAVGKALGHSGHNDKSDS